MSSGPHDRFLDKIATGTMTWDDIADMFEVTHVGQSTGASREQVLARIKTRFGGDLAAVNTWLQQAYARLPAAIKPRPTA